MADELQRADDDRNAFLPLLAPVRIHASPLGWRGGFLVFWLRPDAGDWARRARSDPCILSSESPFPYSVFLCGVAGVLL